MKLDMFSPYQKTIRFDSNARFWGISSLRLMEKVGQKVAEFINNKWGKGKNIAIFCGLGNNGGDGFVAARYLSSFHKVTLFLVGLPSKIKGKEAKFNWQQLKKTEVKIIKLGLISELGEKKINFTLLNQEIKKQKFDIIIEALVGAGLKGELEDHLKRLVKKLNKLSGQKISIDVAIPHFKADFVLACGESKTLGDIVLDLGLPKKIKEMIGPGEVKLLYQPPPSSHKKDNGMLMIIGGSKKYHGAPIFAAKIAAKIVDLVYFASIPEVNILIQSMKKSFPAFVTVQRSEIEKYIKECDSVLIGPGIGKGENEEFKKLLKNILSNYKTKKIILDADAIREADKKLLGPNIVLTPHKFEFKTLFGIEATQDNVKKMAKKYKTTIVLKGVIDIICSEKECKYNSTGNAGMTKGGTGDVLAGLIAALSCKNDLFLAACAGVFLNGLAGDRLYKKYNFWYSAEDLIKEIPKAYKWCLDF